MPKIKTINGIYLTEIICFPRSGHHWLMSMLEEVYFANRISYCERYEHPERMIEQCADTNVQKNHDEGGDTPIRSDRRYIVQIRDPLEALPSRWKAHLAREDATELGFINNEECWRQTMKRWIDYYSRFVSKWIYDEVPNRLILRYNDLLSDPLGSLRKVVDFIDVAYGFDEDLALLAIDRFPPQVRSYRPALFNFKPIGI